jgi:hypothetical protein
MAQENLMNVSVKTGQPQRRGHAGGVCEAESRSSPLTPLAGSSSPGHGGHLLHHKYQVPAAGFVYVGNAARQSSLAEL